MRRGTWGKSTGLSVLNGVNRGWSCPVGRTSHSDRGSGEDTSKVVLSRRKTLFSRVGVPPSRVLESGALRV